MNNVKKLLSRFLVVSLLAGTGITAFALSQNRSATPTRAVEERFEHSERVYTASDFENEVDASSEGLSVKLSQSTTTETSQNLTFNFKSKTLQGYSPARNNYVVYIDDANFTGDVSKPAEDGYDRLDEDGLPIFNGAIIYVFGKNSSANLYLPSTLTRKGSFTISISKIHSHAITGDGSFGGKNVWGKIKNLYIPSEIEEINKDAFVNVPNDVNIHVEHDAMPVDYDDDWTDAPAASVEYSATSYNKPDNKKANAGGSSIDLTDAPNFILGCKNDEEHADEGYNRPLVVEYYKMRNGVREEEPCFDVLPVLSTNNPYDSCGIISSASFSRMIGYKFDKDETIDDHSIIFHNIMKSDDSSNIDTTQTYWVKPTIAYESKQDLSNLLTFKASANSTFAGYSLFTLTMDKTLVAGNEKYPDPHLLYLDVKSDMYEQNITNINSGKTRIRYLLYNLYTSSYRFEYVSGGVTKEAIVPISTVISYQELNQLKGNKVSVMVKDSDVAPDFSADKVVTFELVNLTIQMDLITTSETGSVTKLAKSDINYKFAYLTIFEGKKANPFNWNVFLAIYIVGVAALYAAGSFIFYRVTKEKFKNDEFRRVNGKKYLKSTVLGGLGTLVVALAALFIILRTAGFKNTIVVFNPTDPLLIAFSIAGLIIIGYFIVYLVKLVKAEKDRRKAIRLKLNEDVEDDGTN